MELEACAKLFAVPNSIDSLRASVMAVARQISSMTRCLACQSTTLNRFLSLAGLVASRPLPIRRKIRSSVAFQLFSTSRTDQLNTVNSSPKPAVVEEEQLQDEVQTEQESDGESSELQTSSTPWYLQTEHGEEAAGTETIINEDLGEHAESQDQTISSVPWYLQEQHSFTLPASKSEREKLPELPTDPPEKLQPILEHLSTNIGLDYLTLLDMRALDPPPPLGSNLIMLIGTARSEKHLHVSAERFSRWLRNAYRLTPTTDGLIGRNEFKRRMRRKAKRAKLLRSVNGQEEPSRDDGLSTAWICVNAGFIDEHIVQEHALETEGAIGFGTKIIGTRLVVQMMTEERRNELDLETLWNNYLKRQVRRETEAVERWVTPDLSKEGGNEVGSTYSNSQQPIADTLSSARYQPQAAQLLKSNSHVRTFHSTAKQLKGRKSSRSEAASSSSSKQGPKTRQASPKRAVKETITHGVAKTESQPSSAKQLLDELTTRSSEEIVAALGHDHADLDSTEFLRSFYGSFPRALDLPHWEYLFTLTYVGMLVKHPGYTADGLLDLLERLDESGISIEANSIGPIIRPSVRYVLDLDMSHNDRSVFVRRLQRLIEVLQNMDTRGLPVLAPDTCEALFLATIKARLLDPEKPDIRPDAVWHLARVLETKDLHPKDPRLHARVLEALATAGDWREYWRYWRGIARRQERRPQFLYVQLFRSFTKLNHSKYASEVLDEWIPEMPIEEPPVEITADLARNISACVQVADPTVVDQAEQRGNEHGQWVRLWRRCEARMNQPPEDKVDIVPELDRIRGEFEGIMEQINESRVSRTLPTTPQQTPEEMLDDL